ncbi:MAG TPA: SRPBCC family protein [Asticcacaulis sp.]|nr:SRPBCC family protein [Asticcacaulis sp.]
MRNTGLLKVTLPSDREVCLTRVFNAPRALVYDAFTKPELMKRWFGPRGWNLTTCEMDVRVGGKWRFILTGPEGRTMGMSGEYVELSPPDRTVHIERFDDFPGDAVVTTVLIEADGKTTLTATVLSPNKETRDAVIASGMEHGAAETYDRLAEVLTETVKTL